MDTAHDQDDAGHYQTAGQGIAGMGVLSITLGIMAMVTGAELGFIGPGAMVCIGLVFGGVGAAMMRVREA